MNLDKELRDQKSDYNSSSGEPDVMGIQAMLRNYNLNQNISIFWWHRMKNLEITKIRSICSLGTMDVCAKFNQNASDIF